jgi:hypothetical protein
MATTMATALHNNLRSFSFATMVCKREEIFFFVLLHFKKNNALLLLPKLLQGKLPT